MFVVPVVSPCVTFKASICTLRLAICSCRVNCVSFSWCEDSLSASCAVVTGGTVNPSCFAAPGPGDNGNFIFPYVKGQKYLNHDLSVFKNFAIGDKGQKLQFRASAYNVLNHPIAFPDPGTNLTLKFDHGKLANANDFGRVPEDNKFGRRIIQLALRFTF